MRKLRTDISCLIVLILACSAIGRGSVAFAQDAAAAEDPPAADAPTDANSEDSKADDTATDNAVSDQAEDAEADSAEEGGSILDENEDIAKKIDELIEQLGDEDYFARQRAYDLLREYSFEAFEALRAATRHEDFEVAARARRLLRALHVQWEQPNDPAPLRSLFKDYGSESDEDRLRRVEQISALPDAAQASEGLCRVVRFDRSELISREAALLLMGIQEKSPEVVNKIVALRLSGSPRVAARWVIAVTAKDKDPDEALKQFENMLARETERLKEGEQDTSHSIVLRLNHQLIKLLLAVDKAAAPAGSDQVEISDRTKGALRSLLKLTDGISDSARWNREMNRLLERLEQWKVWTILDEASKAILASSQAEAPLIYRLAETADQRGQTNRANMLAELARNKPFDVESRLMMAKNLEDKGRFQWAEKEYQKVIEENPADSGDLGETATRWLAAMYHDQLRDQEAADLVEKTLKQIEAQNTGISAVPIDRTAGLTMRMHYYRGLQLKREGDEKGSREQMLKAFESREADTDVLIAVFHLPDLPEEIQTDLDQRMTTMLNLAEQQIRNAGMIHRTIPGKPGVTGPVPDPVPLNLYAWLVGNTKGDIERAIRYSKQSIQICEKYPTIYPNPGGFYDTLAHCYARKQDYAQAVETQRKAAELEPHSGIIGEKLKVFEALLEEQKKEQEGTAEE